MTSDRVLFDTSCLIAGMVQTHAHHDRALPWLTRASCGEITGLVCTHSLAETYAILTTLPLRPKIQPTAALLGIHQNLAAFELISLTQQDYQDTLEELVSLGLAGGVVYDALSCQSCPQSRSGHTADPECQTFLAIGTCYKCSSVGALELPHRIGQLLRAFSDTVLV